MGEKGKICLDEASRNTLSKLSQDARAKLTAKHDEETILFSPCMGMSSIAISGMGVVRGEGMEGCVRCYQWGKCRTRTHSEGMETKGAATTTLNVFGERNDGTCLGTGQMPFLK